MFTENPIMGVGAGNWFLNIYKYPFDDINFFSNGYYWIRYYSHNLYSLILSEMGLFGFVSFLLFWGNLLYKARNTLENYAPAYISVITYLILSCFYNACNFLPFQFNGVQLIAFVSAGLLMSSFSDVHNLMNKWFSFLIFISLFLSICWFSYMAITNNRYHKAISLKENDPEMALSILESIYHPSIFSSRKHNNTLPFEIAKLHLELSNYDKANLNFKEALKISPYDGEYHAAYGDYLKDQADHNAAKIHYLKALKIQKNRHNVNFKLGKIYIEESKKDSALIYLSKLSGTSYEYKSSVLIDKLVSIE
jgi:tetratricopeptide (TPR) repeat protein